MTKTQSLWTQDILDALQIQKVDVSTFVCIHGVTLSERCEACQDTHPGRVRELTQAEAERLYRAGCETLGEPT